eukprot:CAMPEP_0204829112 /NCGR_PEP_ID=MMETSP1346-20131115/7139_1 /ASSEMBLY_ACC=CAM_ASM_000771 /TAXON_ID=215587 /ORGANISM="Aplanochytrium stocchinoi, Strain GSBS06" /LENGTH=526 /DNA_ID=CAMNT_0051958643 /DNA_START=176 /DNA_END=1756 /DNA_ORIENTATION=+
MPERKKLNITGLLPSSVESIHLQLKREMKNLRMKRNDLEKYVYLMELLNRNETLFYRLVVDNIKECMPLVYTPTVGEACQKYSHIWSKPRGIYVSIKDKGNVEQILRNWHTTDIKAIVFTDGERILGLGDLGINGMGIPVGKLQLYSACAGIPPNQCLPVVIDNGTNTEEYLNDELYMGLRQKRSRGAEFEELIEEFMMAAQKMFGKSVLLQFEDFGNSTAFKLLNMTRDRFNTFNDDIQGTACVALGGIMSSLKVEKTPSKLADHKIVFLGAGEAGCGIGSLIAYAISKEDGITIEEARKNIWFIDSKGLITASRDQAKKLPHHKQEFAHDASAFEGPLDNLLDVIKAIKPTMLIGVSATPNAFTKKVCEYMAEINEVPIIFALSNPTHKCECSAQQAYDWTGGKCIFASGSPFGTITSHGKSFEPGQGNNAYIFPGLALGVIAAEAKKIPESLFYETAVCLANLVTGEDYARGSVYPPLEKIRHVSLEIAKQVAESCFKLGLARAKQPDEIEAWIRSKVTDFDY